MSELFTRAKAWADQDPNRTDQEELQALITRAESGDRPAFAELEDRFRGPLSFGTAGLRGVLAAGESRMNEAVVLRATHGLVQHLLATVDRAAERGLVVGRDARIRSDELAQAVAEVAHAHGMRVFFLRDPAPTPVTAFAVKELEAAGGVVVTASHNPPEYNGYKVFYENGAQIISPVDEDIAARIQAAPPANRVQRKSLSGSMEFEPARLESAYLAAVKGLRQPELKLAPIRVAYTPLHGVGGRFVSLALEMAGFGDLAFVQDQSEPDGRFPTVSFPNPEEPSALVRLLNLARKREADVALANDPDADRLAAAVPDEKGIFQILSGNEIGVLLAHHLLTRDGSSDPSRLVITTVVSSQLLAAMAQAMGVRYAETLTGFKWIANEAMRQERDGARFVFGYEEALGYTAGTVARDKDGVGAAVVFAEMVAAAKARGESMPAYLRRIRDTFGHFVARQKSVTLPGSSGASRIQAIMAGLRASPPKSLGPIAVSSYWDLLSRRRTHASGEVEAVNALVPNDTVILSLEDGSRIAVRPSGTEPKIKLYLEVKETAAAGEDASAIEARGQERLGRLLASLAEQVGLAGEV